MKRCRHALGDPLRVTLSQLDSPRCTHCAVKRPGYETQGVATLPGAECAGAHQ
jgi:hypothetical protein